MSEPAQHLKIGIVWIERASEPEPVRLNDGTEWMMTRWTRVPIGIGSVGFISHPPDRPPEAPLRDIAP